MAALSGLFYGINYMATDVDVQFFSHLNGLVLSNNWGDLIRLLDTCLVNGLPLTAITSATIDAQGDLNLSRTQGVAISGDRTARVCTRQYQWEISHQGHT